MRYTESITSTVFPCLCCYSTDKPERFKDCMLRIRAKPLDDGKYEYKGCTIWLDQTSVYIGGATQAICKTVGHYIDCEGML